MKADSNVKDYFEKFSKNSKDAMVFIEFNSFDIIHINNLGIHFFQMESIFPVSEKKYFDLFKFNTIDELVKVDVQKKCLEFGFFENRSSIQFLNNDLALCDFTYTYIVIDEYNKYLSIKVSEVYSEKKNSISYYNSFVTDTISNPKNNGIKNQTIKKDLALEHEIKNHQETKNALNHFQEISKSLFNSSLDTIITSDLNAIITEISPSAIELFGYMPEELLGKSINYLYKDSEECKRVQKQLYNEGHFSGEVLNRHKDNRIFSTFLSCSTLKNKEGDVTGYIGISRDITNQKVTEKLLVDKNSKLQSIFENESNILIWTVNTDYRITSKNSNLHRFLKLNFGINIQIGANLIDTLKPIISEKALGGLRKMYEDAFTGLPRQFQGLLKNKKTGKLVWLEIFLSPSNQMINGKFELTGIAMDISDKKTSEIELTKSLEEKEILLKEVHHRVKNNLQVISSILNLQSSYVKDPSILNILRESQNRVKSMSYIHEILYRSKDFSRVNFTDYINNLTKSILHTFLNINKDVFLELELDQVELNLDQAIPCGLIVNEIVTNAMKYAFKDISNPIIKVKLYNKNNIIHIHIDDNGIGLPLNFNLEESDSLGLQLVYTLIDQLDGTIKVNVQNGTKYLITFAKGPYIKKLIS